VRRSIMIALIALFALVVAAPLAFAQSRGGEVHLSLSLTNLSR
jgi:hypothetical protein